MYLNPEIEKIDPGYYENIFLKSLIYFPTLKELNDPYDSNPAFNIDHCSDDNLIEIILKRKKKSLNREAYRQLEKDILQKKINVREIMHENIKNIARDGLKNRVLSFSETPCSTAMWAHYSNNHKGFCLKFKTSSFGDKFKDIFEDIIYSKCRPILTPENLENLDFNVKEKMFIKSEEWAYEKEWRILDSVKNSPESKIGLQEGFLQGIILGINMNPKEKTLILNWIRNSTYRGNFELKQIALCYKSFDLTVVDI